jgi:hypothetical protein
MPSICLAVLATCPAAAATMAVFSAISISQQLARFFSSNRQDFAEQIVRARALDHASHSKRNWKRLSPVDVRERQAD